jgi:hypothetical protein
MPPKIFNVKYNYQKLKIKGLKIKLNLIEKNNQKLKKICVFFFSNQILALSAVKIDLNFIIPLSSKP